LSSFGERLKKRREEKGLSLRQIETATGITNSNLSKIERNKISPSLDAAALISSCLGESLDYLAKGLVIYDEPDPLINELIELFKKLDEVNQYSVKSYTSFLLTQNQNKKRAPDCGTQTESIKEEKNVYLPVLGSVAAGMPIMAHELVEGFLPVPAVKVKKNTYIVKAKGDSMIDAGINNGDLVMIHPQPSVEQGEMALVKVDGNVTIKKFYRYDHEIRLKPANGNMRDIVITDLAKIKVLGRVIGVIPAEEANLTMRADFNRDT